MFEMGCSSIAHVMEKSKEIWKFYQWRSGFQDAVISFRRFDSSCDFSFAVLYSLNRNKAVDEASLYTINSTAMLG